jgi:Flp pilus assembly protein TadB
MTTLAFILAICSVLYFIKALLYPIYKSAGSSQKKRARQYINARKKEQAKQQKAEEKRVFLQKYGQFLLTDVARERVKNLLKRLDMNMAPEEIRLKQLTGALGAAALTAVAFAAHPLLGFLSVLLVVSAYLKPMDKLIKKIEAKEKSIAQSFPAFYSMVYYQYSKTVHIFLADIIKDYLPSARGELAKELGIMLDNIEYGEEYALKQLKKRVPIHYVIKFCDIMEIRLRGYDNTAQMSYLKNEIDAYRLDTLEKELAKRMAANGRLQFVLVIVLGIYLMWYFGSQVTTALKMFQ